MSDLKNKQPELWTRGFLGLQLAQFMGAFNDNVVKITLMLLVASGSGNLWAGDLGPGGQSYISLIMTIPFLLLLDFSGRCADRFSKSRIVFWVKVSEIPISIVIAIGLITGSIWLTLIGYTLLMMESAFFNPSKYGMIREVIMTRHLSRGNGLMNMTTNMAIILGTAVGGPLLGFGFWPLGAAIVIISIMGFAGVFIIPPLPAIQPTTALTPWPGISSIRILLRMRKHHPVEPHLKASVNHEYHPMLLVTVLWAWFWFSAVLVTLIVPEYKGLLDISDTATGGMLALLGIAIGLSCAAAGYMSGGRVRMSLIKFGAFGLALFFLLLAVLPQNYWLAVALLCLAGLSAGFYLVPLQALIQQAAPNDMRAQYVSSSNWLCYLLMTIAAVVFKIASTMDIPVSWIYGFCAVAMALTLIPLILYRKLLSVAEECGFDQPNILLTSLNDSR